MGFIDLLHSIEGGPAEVKQDTFLRRSIESLCYRLHRTEHMREHHHRLDCAHIVVCESLVQEYVEIVLVNAENHREPDAKPDICWTTALPVLIGPGQPGAELVVWLHAIDVFTAFVRITREFLACCAIFFGCGLRILYVPCGLNRVMKSVMWKSSQMVTG